MWYNLFMSDNIQFETDQPQFRSTQQASFNQSQTSGMTAWLIRKGIIKDESQAGAILGGVVIFNFLLTALVIYFFVF